MPSADVRNRIERSASEAHSAYHRLVVLVGVSDAVVVDTPDALLVVDRSRSEELKKVVDELRRRRRKDLL